MRYLIVLLSLLSAAECLAQPAYKLEFRIRGWKDTTAYLGYYLGENTYLQDTARVNSKGEFEFEGKQALPVGVYFLVLNKTKFSDFVVGADQQFRMETDAVNFVQEMKVVGDDDNKAYFENAAFQMEKHKEAEPYLKIIQDTSLHDEAKKKEARDAFSKLSEQVIGMEKKLIESHPTYVCSRVFKASLPIEVPDAPKRADGSIDSSFQFHYYRDHFFDNFDVADEALLRLPKPLYHEKVKEYLDKLFVPHPDTVTAAVFKLVEKARKNSETYKFMVTTCMFLYQTPEIMGLDEVFVNIYNKYFLTGEMDYWASSTVKKNLKEYADKLSRAMIGRTAPNLILQDQNYKPRSLYDIKTKYTIVYFFDPDCGHCRQESPKLVDFYNKNKAKFGLEVYAVSADTSIAKLRNYITEMKMTWITVDGPRSYLSENYRNLYYAETFPTIYILDEKKKVIARKLPVERLGDFLSNYEKFQKRKMSKGT